MQCGAIRLVQNRASPVVIITLTDDRTRSPIDLSPAGTLVNLLFRDAGTKQVLFTQPCNILDGGTTGLAEFSIDANSMDIPTGSYEGVVQITVGGVVTIVRDTIQFRVSEAV